MEEQLKMASKETKKTTYKEIETVAKQFLKMEAPPKEVFTKLVDSIYFYKNRKIEINLTFEQIHIENEKMQGMVS